MRLARPLAALAAVTLFAMSCEPSRSLAPTVSADFVAPPPHPVPSAGDGNTAYEEGQICKYGTSASFHYTIFDRTTLVTTTHTITLADGECQVIAFGGAAGQRVTVTEDPSANYMLNHVDKFDLAVGVSTSSTIPGSPNPTIVDSVMGGQTTVRGFTLKFYNDATVGQIGDFVWNDLNGNGLQDAGEPGIGGLTVTLSGMVSATTTTNGAGGYLFTNLPAGSYTVTVATPAGFNASPSTVGTDTTIDSNGSPASVTLPAGTSSNLTIDFGFVRIPAAQLAVNKTPDNGSFAPNGQASFTIVVSNPGTGLAATNVQLTDALPGNGGLVWQTATTSQGTCAITSNALSCSLGSLAAGASATVIVSSTTTTPNAACTSQPNPAAIATADGPLTAQDAGSLGCTPPPPTGQIGDFVWKDLNGNGVQDAGEPGIAGLTVTLAGPVSGTTTTNASGIYNFGNLPAGTYTVSVGTPGGLTPSPTGAGTAATDNNGSPASVTLPTSSSIDLTIDFGFKTAVQPPTQITVCKVGTIGVFTLGNGGSGSSGDDDHSRDGHDDNGRKGGMYTNGGSSGGGYGGGSYGGGSNGGGYGGHGDDGHGDDGHGDDDGSGHGGSGSSFTLQAGGCKVIDTHVIASAIGSQTITENVQSGTALDSIVVVGPTGHQKYTYKTSVTVSESDQGSTTVTFFNHVVPPHHGGHGCSSSYWGDSSHDDSYKGTGYSRDTQFSSVFGSAFQGKSLDDMLHLSGNTGLNALGREAAAALLNASHPDVGYNLTVSQVIRTFNSAISSHNYDAARLLFQQFNTDDDN